MSTNSGGNSNIDAEKLKDLSISTEDMIDKLRDDDEDDGY